MIIKQKDNFYIRKLLRKIRRKNPTYFKAPSYNPRKVRKKNPNKKPEKTPS